MSIDDTWKYIDRFVEIRAPWQTIYGEKYFIKNLNQEVDYWRIEKPDSIIIIPICNQNFILQPPTFRPGAGKKTLDFPGGRLLKNKTPKQSAEIILLRELGIQNRELIDIELTPINSKGLLINSSFTNQRLFGFSAKLLPDNIFDNDQRILKLDITGKNYLKLISELECLQCRSLLMEYWTSVFNSSEYS